MKKLIIILFLICITTPAESASIFTQLYVRHACGDTELNEHNNIIGMTIGRVMYTHFTNSFNRDSWTLAYDLTDKPFLRESKSFETKIHLYTGILYGYGDGFISWQGHRVVMAPTIETNIYKNISIEWFYVPDAYLGTFISVLKLNF